MLKCTCTYKGSVMNNQITLNLLPEDFSEIKRMAKLQRRKPAEVIRNLLEDIVEGAVEIRVDPDVKIKRHGLTVRVDDSLRTRIDELTTRHGKSIDKIVHIAVEAVARRENEE